MQFDAFRDRGRVRNSAGDALAPPGAAIGIGTLRNALRAKDTRFGSRQQKRVSGMKNLLVGLLGIAAVAWTVSAASATTLEDVKAKGFLQCGVNTGLAGFSAP